MKSEDVLPRIDVSVLVRCLREERDEALRRCGKDAAELLIQQRDMALKKNADIDEYNRSLFQQLQRMTDDRNGCQYERDQLQAHRDGALTALDERDNAEKEVDHLRWLYERERDALDKQNGETDEARMVAVDALRWGEYWEGRIPGIRVPREFVPDKPKLPWREQ